MDVIVYLIETKARIIVTPVPVIKHIKQNTQHAPLQGASSKAIGIEPLKPVRDNAHMGDERAYRIDGALSGLIKNLIPSLPNDDGSDAEEKLRQAVLFAKSILHRYTLQNMSFLVSC